MAATVLSLLCLIVLLATRSRLERAERRLLELDLTLNKLQSELTLQAQRLAKSEAQRPLAAPGFEPADVPSTPPTGRPTYAEPLLPLTAAPRAPAQPPVPAPATITLGGAALQPSAADVSQAARSFAAAAPGESSPSAADA